MTTFADAIATPSGVALNPNLGRQAVGATRSFNLCNEDLAAINAIATALAGTLTVTANVGTGTQPVSGTIAATQSGTWNIGSITTLPALAAGSAVIGALTANQSVNQTQVNGVAMLTGNGVTGTGSMRVTIASDQTAFSVNAVQSGTWNIATLTNLSQFGGAAINLGAGTVGTGTLRVTQASDSPEIAALGAPADAAWTTGSGSHTAILKTIAGAALDTTTPSPVKIDQTTPGTTNRVALPELTAAANVAKTYSGTFVVAASNLTRPANTTAYSALDSISNNATAGSVTANSVSLSDTNDHPIDLVEILLDSNDTGPGTAGAKITLHLFNSDPTALTGVIGGDNAAWSNKKAGWVGSFTGTMTLFSDGSRGVLIPDAGTLRMIAPTSGAKTVFWQLQTQTAFTPSAVSTVFLPTFKGFQSRPA